MLLPETGNVFASSHVTGWDDLFDQCLKEDDMWYYFHLIQDGKPPQNRWVGKVNFVEIRSFWHIFRSFDRMWSFFILCLQVQLFSLHVFFTRIFLLHFFNKTLQHELCPLFKFSVNFLHIPFRHWLCTVYQALFVHQAAICCLSILLMLHWCDIIPSKMTWRKINALWNSINCA